VPDLDLKRQSQDGAQSGLLCCSRPKRRTPNRYRSLGHPRPDREAPQPVGEDSKTETPVEQPGIPTNRRAAVKSSQDGLP